MSVSMKLNGASDLKKSLKDGLRSLTDEMAKDYYNELRKETPYKTGNARSGWRLNQTTKGSKIKNKVPYIQRLEDGYSSQARSGMTTPAKKTIQKNIAAGKYKMKKKRK